MISEPGPKDQSSETAPKNPWVSKPADQAGGKGAEPAAAPPPPPSQPAPSSKSPSQPPAGARWRLGALAAAAAGAAIALGVFLATIPVWWPHVETVLSGTSTRSTDRSADLIARLEQLEAVENNRAGREAAQLNSLAQRIQDIEARLESLRQLAASAQGGGEVGVLAERLARIETEANAFGDVAQRLSQLESRTSAETTAETTAMNGLDRRLSALTERLNQIEQSGTAEDANVQARAAVLALGQLRERVHGGKPFTSELGALGALWPGEANASMAALRAHADTGVPTIETLKQRFQSAATAALRNAGEPGEGWLNRAGNWMRSLVVVRPVAGGMPEGTAAAAVIARAETRLRAGDLAQAIGELGALGPAPAQPFVAWIDDARALQAVENALAALEIQAIARLGRS